MKESMRPGGYVSNNLGGDGFDTPPSKHTGYDDKTVPADYSPNRGDYDTAHGVVEDHYGGKKLGMTRVRHIYPANDQWTMNLTMDKRLP